jgi:uncharacterized membrane protein
MLSPDQVDRLEESRSTDTAIIFIGWFLVVSGCFFILFLDWDRRGGTSMMEFLFAGEVLIGLTLVTIGSIKRRMVLRQMDAEHCEDFEAREGAAKAAGSH